MALECIVFDCDGIILESVPIKTLAFERISAPFGEEARDRMLMYHRLHGGVSRIRKFEWFYREVLGREITRQELQDALRRFEEIAFEEVLNCPLVPGVQEVLSAWQGRVPLYVCSGAPHEELTFILQKRGLATFFVEICGTPPAKDELLRAIVRKSGADAAATVMVGDSPTDLYAAESAGTLFYGRGEEMRGGNYPWGEDLTGLNYWLEQQWATTDQGLVRK